MSKTMAITGGTKGIGAAITEKFYAEGWSVVIGARTDNGFAGSLGDRASFVAMDVAGPDAHQTLCKTAIEKTGRLDAYINCAGVSAWRPVSEIDPAFWSRMIDVNLSGTFWGCQAASAHLTEGGSIINVSSLAGKRGSANNSAYCAAKFGVNGITQALAKELGGQGVRVNAVCPVYVETPGLLEALEDARSPTQGADTAAYFEDFAKSQAALKRLPLGSEVADLCFYLASEQSSAVTGQCINVDCGVLPQ